MAKKISKLVFSALDFHYLCAINEFVTKGKKKILFIINPKSGVSGKRNIPKLIKSLLNKALYEFEIKETEYVAHATELARGAVAASYDAVVAVGGDGTVNEVARALVDTNVALGIIPCGSGNGLARHLGVPLDVKKAIEFINTAESVAVDYGKINGLPFFCTCGMGFDAIVSNSFAQGTRRGLIGYMNQTLLDWVKYKPAVYHLESESFEKEYKAFLIACGNAAQYGNNAYISPNASMRDGLLSITVWEPFPAVDVPLILSQLFGRSLDKNGHIKTLEAKWLKIKREKPGPVHFDGEPANMDAEIFVEIVPRGLAVLATPGWDGKPADVPLYKQLFDLFSGSVPNVEISLPKVEISLPKVNVHELKGVLPQMPSLPDVTKIYKRKGKNKP